MIGLPGIAHQPHDGRKIHNASHPPPHHMPAQMTNHIKRPLEVDSNDVIELLFFHAQAEVICRHARAIDQYVDFAEIGQESVPPSVHRRKSQPHRRHRPAL